MSPRAFLTAVFAAVVLSGCMGGDGPDDDAGPIDWTPEEGACEFSIFPGVRGREVDIAVDPNDRTRVAATAMLTPPAYADLPGGADLAVWQALGRSLDGGMSWDWAFLPGHPGTAEWFAPPYTGTIGLGDGIVSFAPDGQLYLSAIVLNGGLQYNMLSYRFEGESLQPAGPPTVFSRGAYAEPLNDVPGVNPVAYNDKNDQAVDPDSGDWYVSWMWRSNLQGMTTVPVVVRSSDGGASWDGPVMLVDSLLAGVTSEHANVAPVPLILGDSVIVVWAQADTNTVWAAAAPRGSLDFGQPYEILRLAPGGSAAGNILTLPLINVATGPGPGGVGERAWLTVVQGGDGYDVGVWYSDDGTAWHAAATPHAETANAQLIPTVAVAPDGRVAVQYLDFSADAADQSYHAVAAVSDDGGMTWMERRLTSVATDSTQAGDAVQGHVGDYFGNAFTSVGLLGAWQDGRDGSASASYSEIYGCIVTV